MKRYVRLGSCVMVRYKCSTCRVNLESPPETEGRDDICPSCGHPTAVPFSKWRKFKRMLHKLRTVVGHALAKHRARKALRTAERDRRRRETPIVIPPPSPSEMRGLGFDMPQKSQDCRSSQSSNWRGLAGFFGVLLIIVAWSQDTTVSTGWGGRVHNIGLLNDRLLLFFTGALLCVISVLGKKSGS